MKVLIIDDDKFVRTVYESEFHQENVAVVLASDGKAGLALALQENPTLIIMELILPKLNGFEVIGELKKDNKLKKVPILICSSLSQKSDIDEAMSLGVEKYLPKENYSLKQVVAEALKILLTQ